MEVERRATCQYGRPWPMARAGLIEADVAVVGAGAAGLYAALTASQARARASRWCPRRALARTASLLGAGRPRRGAGGRRLARAPPRGHARRGPRRRACSRPRGCSARTRRRGCASWRHSACASTPTASGASRSGLEGGHTRPPGRARRRQRHRPAHHPPAVRRRGREDERIVVLEAHRAAALHVDDGPLRRRASATTGPPSPRAAWCSPAAARPRCGRARPTRPAPSAAGCCSHWRAGAPLADLELMQFHPTAVVDPRRTDVAGRRRRSVEGFLITEAIRGEGAILLDGAGERFVDELAPRDEVARAIRSAPAGRPARPRCGLDMRMVDPRALPQRRQRPARRRARADARAGPGGAGGALPDGRRRHRCRRALAAARPVRGRRVRLHRPARREPARVQLAVGVLRVRPPGRARGARRAAARRRRQARGGEPLETAATTLPSPETRAAVWELAGLERDRAGWSALREDPTTRSRGSSPPARSRARRAAARTGAATTPTAIRPSTGTTRCSRPAPIPCSRRWT